MATDVRVGVDLNNPPEIVLKRFRVRPLRQLEETLIINGEFEARPSEWVKKAWERNLSGYLTKDFRFAYDNLGNTIIVIMGPTGDGKSVTTGSIALYLQRLLNEIHSLDARIFLTFSTSETFRVIKQMRKGDILFQDENPILSGEGATTIRNAIYNIQANVRANLNSFLFASPSQKGYSNICHIILETFGFNPEDGGGLNRVKVYSAKTERELGWALIPRLRDHAFEITYSERKQAHIAQLMQHQGQASAVYDPKQLAAEAKHLLQVATTLQHDYFPQVDINKKFLEIAMLGAHIPGSITYQSNVIKFALLILENQKEQGSVSTSSSPPPKVSLQHVTFNEGLFTAFLQAMQQFIATRLPYDSKRTKYNIAQECAEIYPLYLAYHHLGKRHRIKKIKLDLESPLQDYVIHRRLHALLDFLKDPDVYRQVGELYEAVFCAYHRRQGATVRQGGGSIAGDFDALVDTEVWSLKCYHDEKNGTIKIYYQDVSQKEQELCRATGSPLHISFLNPYWGAELSLQIPIDEFKAQNSVRFSRPPAKAS